jgi:hypothetical protein
MTQHNETVIPNLGLLVLDVQDVFLGVCANVDNFTLRTRFCVEQRPEVLGTTTEKLAELATNTETVTKTGFSAFTEPATQTWIDKYSIHHILVIGLETPICVYQTALDAINQEIDVTLLSDAITCRRPSDAEVALASLRIHGAHVLPSETVFYSILRDSKHPLFKEFTRLVKKYSAK